jgi:hypothetical protein
VKEHQKRRIEYSKDALPEKGTSEYDRIMKILEMEDQANPSLKKEIKKKHDEAVKTLELQGANGIELFLDPELRYYLGEFNYRSWNYGHRKMPIMFNVMDAFFILDKRINYWTLLDEEDYSISFFDFIDFYTSNNLIISIDEIQENFEENLIYNFNVGYDLKEITFKNDSGEEFVIAGVSLIRHANEVSMLFVTGQITNTIEETNKLASLENYIITPGKEEIKIAPERKREAVKLNDDPNLWKILIACRFDLDSNTIDARYIAKDEGNSFSVITDDVTGFMKNGMWRENSSEKTYQNLASKIEGYSSIFELAKVCLHLPRYFNQFESEILEKEFETEIKSILKNPLKARDFKDVDNKFKIRNRTLWILNRNLIFKSDRIKLRDENFKIETSGYWKKLIDNEIGTGKKGQPISGKTWVQKTESYYLSKEENLIIEKKKDPEFTNKNAGKIYILRNSNYEKDIYKIGLTTKTVNERAEQLSNTSVPDKFSVMREWDVKDCYLAEKIIHKELDIYRIDSRREFFKMDMRIANDVIDTVVQNINKNEDA